MRTAEVDPIGAIRSIQKPMQLTVRKWVCSQNTTVRTDSEDPAREKKFTLGFQRLRSYLVRQHCERISSLGLESFY